MANWKQMALKIGDARIQYRLAEGDPAAEARAEKKYREALGAMARAVAGELAELDRPEPAAPVEEKPAGYLPEGWRSGA